MNSINDILEHVINNHPSFLFRYQPPDIQRASSALIRNQLYASSPIKFNDPDDTVIKFDESGTDDEWAMRLLRLCESQSPDMSDYAKKHLVKEAIRNKTYKNMPGNDSKRLKETTGVICFTDKYNDEHMWKKYAKNDSGFCLCYRYDPTDRVMGRSLPVQYTDTYPLYKYVNIEVKDVIVELMITKQTKWKYENEWRLVFIEGANRHQSITPNALVGIVYGYNTKHKFINKCRKLAKKRKLPIQIWKRNETETLLALK